MLLDKDVRAGNIETGFEVRILEDLLDPREGGLFFLAASGLRMLLG